MSVDREAFEAALKERFDYSQCMLLFLELRLSEV